MFRMGLKPGIPSPAGTWESVCGPSCYFADSDNSFPATAEDLGWGHTVLLKGAEEACYWSLEKEKQRRTAIQEGTMKASPERKEPSQVSHAVSDAAL